MNHLCPSNSTITPTLPPHETILPSQNLAKCAQFGTIMRPLINGNTANVVQCHLKPAATVTKVRGRLVLGRARANTIWCSRQLCAGSTAKLVEAPGGCRCGERRAPPNSRLVLTWIAITRGGHYMPTCPLIRARAQLARGLPLGLGR